MEEVGLWFINELRTPDRRGRAILIALAVVFVPIVLFFAYLSLSVMSAHNPEFLGTATIISLLISTIVAVVGGIVITIQGVNGGPHWRWDKNVGRYVADSRIYATDPDPKKPLRNASITAVTLVGIIGGTMAGATPAMVSWLHCFAIMAAMMFGFSRYGAAYHGKIMRPLTAIAGVFALAVAALEWAMFLWRMYTPQVHIGMGAFPSWGIWVLLGLVAFVILRKGIGNVGNLPEYVWILIAIVVVLSVGITSMAGCAQSVIAANAQEIAGNGDTANYASPSPSSITECDPSAKASVPARAPGRTLIGKIAKNGEFLFRPSGAINFGVPENVGPEGSSWHTGLKYGDQTRRRDLPSGGLLVQVGKGRMLGISEIEHSDDGYKVTGHPGQKVYAMINESPGNCDNNIGTFNIY